MARRFAFPGLLALAVLALAVWPGATRGAAEPSEQRTVVAAMFFSNFCGPCRILDPRLDDVLAIYDDPALDFVKLDQSFSLVTGRRTAELAERHGISGVYEQLQGQTGFVALIDPRDEQVIEIVTIQYSRDDIRDAFDRAVATVNTREIG